MLHSSIVYGRKDMVLGDFGAGWVYLLLCPLVLSYACFAIIETCPDWFSMGLMVLEGGLEGWKAQGLLLTLPQERIDV